MAREDGRATITLEQRNNGLWLARGYGKESPPHTKKTAALGELIRILNRYNSLSPPLFIVDGLPDDHYIDKCIHASKIDETFVAWEEGCRWMARFTGYALSGFGETRGEAIGDLILFDIMPAQNEATGDLLPFGIIQKPVKAAAEPDRPVCRGETEIIQRVTEIIITCDPDNAWRWHASCGDMDAAGDTKAEALGHLLAIMIPSPPGFEGLLGQILAHMEDDEGPRIEFYSDVEQRSEGIHNRKIKAVID